MVGRRTLLLFEPASDADEAAVALAGGLYRVDASTVGVRPVLRVGGERKAIGARTLGLGQVDIVVPGADDLGSLGERMSHHGIPTRHDGQTLSFDDPWANAIRVTAASS